ncbi:MAG: anti-sigma factor [Acidobacteriia bacterium]|nr:anti-sigma factor [Terriglobia bacterium]
MECEQLAAFYEEYALGVLEGEERAEMEAHLARGCERCTAGATEARRVVSNLALAAPEAQLPSGLRGKIMEPVRLSAAARAGAPPVNTAAKREVFPAWAWIAAAALALITGYAIRQMGNQNSQLAALQKQMKLAIAQNVALQNQLDESRMVASVMLSPDSTALKLMPKDKNMPMVHAYLHPHMGVAITADQMPAMPSARTLQLWFMPKQGAPMSVAIFHPDANGVIALVAPVKMPVAEIAALAVTEEPAGGSPQPTSAPAWMAAMN